METSEKRKERLRAMRLEAEASQDDTSAPVPGYLSNPLADDDVAQEEPCVPSRFGFYTDPMAGFSTDTKRSKIGDHIAPNSFKHSDMGTLPPPPAGRPMNPERPPPRHQFQSNYSPGQNMYQQNFSPRRNPTGMIRPFEMHHGNPPQPWNGAGGSASHNFSFDPSGESRPHGLRFRPPGSPGYRPTGIPGFNPPMNPGFRSPSNSGYGPPGVPGLGLPESPGYRPPSSGYRQPSPGYGPPSPGYRPPGSPSNIQQGRGNWITHSPSPHSGHRGYHSSSSGRGRGYPGSGGRGGRGRGRGSQGYPVFPEQLYNASMVEDPWKGLSPVTWQALPPVLQKYHNTPFGGNKNKASTAESSNQFNPQPNLAEYLAASLNETIKEESTEANQKKEESTETISVE